MVDVKNQCSLPGIVLLMASHWKPNVSFEFDVIHFMFQVFPTNVRSFGLGSSSAFARIGAMTTPFVAQVSKAFVCWIVRWPHGKMLIHVARYLSHVARSWRKSSWYFDYELEGVALQDTAV